MKDPNCIFCRIAEEKAPSHKVWEDDNHIAFLSIFPNTEGFTVVATKDHYPSDAFINDEQIYLDLMKATRTVGNLLTKAFPDVDRTGMFLEGFGVDHLHSKLFPMHGTGDMKDWKMIESSGLENVYFDHYPGYLSSHGGKRMDDKKLAEIAQKIRSASTKK